MEKVLEARGLTKKPLGKSLFNHIEFELGKGEVLALVGGPDSGKSSIMKALYGAESVDQGDIMVSGISVNNDTLRARHKIGVVAQGDNFDNDLPALESLIVHASYFGIPFRQARSMARDWFRILGCDESQEGACVPFPKEFLHKMLMARALVSNPQIVLLDGFTARLNASEMKGLRNVLQELKKQGKSIVFSTRSAHDAEFLADRALVIREGETVLSGVPRDLVLKNVGKEVIEFPVEAEDLDYHIERIRGKYEFLIANKKIVVFVPLDKIGRDLVPNFSSPAIQVRRANFNDVLLKTMGGHYIPRNEVLRAVP
ncbi:MAG: ABC transporter ATP-binding protein [Bdellovibrionales bacterium]|nr:ABC transporter ATP-binding protein [Bdellovibrionales bacterium]